MRQLHLLLYAAILLAAIGGQAQTRTVWQIGKFDQSPVELSSTLARDIAAQSPRSNEVVFRAGSSDAEKDWPANQRAGHTYQVVFPLASITGAYTLKIGTLIEQPRIPALKIEVNGHAGVFYLHPKLSYARDDYPSYSFDPHESQSAISVQLPPQFLKAGENTIAITCINDPPSAPGEEDISAIGYDALSLSQDAAAKFDANSLTADVQPTVFYRRQGAGLMEVVDAFVRFGHPIGKSEADLQMGGRHFHKEIPTGQDFGEQRLSFDVPAWNGTTAASLTVKGSANRTFPLQLTPERQWTVFVVPHTHLDVGFTDYQGKVAETQPRVLTQAADLIHQNPDFRFSMDGSWNLEQLLNTRPKPKQDEILGLIRDGKMALPAQYVNVLTGYASLETLYRSLYLSKELSRHHQLPFEYANITDVPTYSGSYPSILASSGVKYFTAASNNDRAPVFHYEHWNEKSPFWWQGPDGQKILFWYSRHYMQVQSLFGLPPQAKAIRESLPVYLQAYSQPSYKPDAVMLYGAQVENTDLYPSIATFATSWNKEYAFPRLQYATFPDFFHYIDRHYGDSLPTYKGDGGGYWEDGIGSDAYFAAEDRTNQNRALSAEILSTATHTLDPDLNPPKGQLDDIWRNIILFAEHTWEAYNALSQPASQEAIRQTRVKDDRAERASLEIDDLINRSLSQLANQTHVPANTLMVFNSLNWKRDALVETDLLFHNPKLIDLSNQQTVPFQVLYSKQGFLHVRFQAKDLPAVGYKCFRVEHQRDDERQASPQPAPREKVSAIENTFYKIRIDEMSGAVSSIYDKQAQREIVDPKSAYRFGQYLYVSGGDGQTQMIDPVPTYAPANLTVHPAVDGRLEGVERTPWGHSIFLTSASTNTPRIQSEILLFDNEKKIEFRYRIQKTYTEAKEGVYIAFPTAVSNPAFSYATQQGWVDPARDLLKGASLEWFNVQQWMAARDPKLTVGIVPVDAPLASFGDINRGRWPGEFNPLSGTIYSYIMNNYWTTNYRAGQGGDYQFRYVMTSNSQFDGQALTRMGWQEMRPVELNNVVGQDKPGNPDRPLPPSGQGFLETDSPAVVLVTWKQAQDGRGSILRLAETAGKPTEATVHFSQKSTASATLCSGVEEDKSPLAVQNNSVKVSFRPFEVSTIRVQSK